MLTPCLACGTYVRSSGTCPHCAAVVGAPSPRRARSAAAALLGLALAGCPADNDTFAQAMYGDIPTDTGVDADEDGWTVEAGDCDDGDATIHPDATETAGDGIDSNCDDSDDT